MNAHHLALDASADTAFVGRVERRIDRHLEAERCSAADASSVADEAAGYLTTAGSAKRARPRLVRQFGAALGLEAAVLVDLAASAELIHTASLLHDDVVDEARTRRGLKAAHLRWGNQVAILGGDLLLCHGLKLLEAYPVRIYHSAVEVIMEMTRGIVRELEARFLIETSVADWRHMAMGKTAALLGWCGYAPAIVAGEAECAERFDRCGRHLGVAFQLADDLKDLLDASSGKDRFADIRNGNPSYPLLWAVQASEEVRQRLEASWAQRTRLDDTEEIQRIGEAVLDSGALDQTAGAIDLEISRALAALGSAGERPGGQQVRSWANLLIRSVERMVREHA